MTPIIDKQLLELTLSNIDIILDALKIGYNKVRGRFFFSCPIHNSDNYSSLVIYDSGNWLCFTRNCHKNYQHGIFGFVAACKQCSIQEAMDFCSLTLNGERPTKTTTRTKYIDYRFKEVDRSLIIPNVNSNIEFYLRRGYSKEILEKYDVFLCTKRTSNLYGRVVFPIYNDDRMFARGFVGRTLNPKCDKCKKFHPLGKSCPQLPYEKIRAEKWLNSRGFSRTSTLFNYWFAKEYIRESKEVILVEGQGDVLKLEMAGIKNSVGIFGTILTEKQRNLLYNSGARHIYIAMDADAAGKEAASLIIEQLKDFDTSILVLENKDFGDMTVQEINTYFTKKV